MTEPRLSFILIEYHSLEDLPPALEAIAQACGELPYEVILSSNSVYPPEQQAQLEKDFPHARWVFNPGNGGFASGMNAGIRVARGEWIVLSNPDARVRQGDFSGLIDWFGEHPHAGLLGPRITGEDGTLQDSCRAFMTLPRFIARQLKRFCSGKTVLPDKAIDMDTAQPVDWVIGGFMMVRRAALEAVGLLDEGYFLYVEDMDWCKRFWDAGWQVWYVPQMQVCYAGDRKSTAGMARGVASRYSWWHLRSYCRFLRKHGLLPRRREVRA